MGRQVDKNIIGAIMELRCSQQSVNISC